MRLVKQAEENLTSRLKDNPCRGIVIGMGTQKVAQQIAWIMGRSTNSQNRIYASDGKVLRTEAADESKVEDPELIIYPVMRSFATPDGGTYLAHIVSNGDQTDTVAEMFSEKLKACGVLERDEAINPGVFAAALRTRYCEPDPSNFTARVTGYSDPSRMDVAYMSILKADTAAKEIWVATADEHGASIREKKEAEGLKGKELNEAVNVAIGEICGLNHRAFPTVRNTFELPLRPGIGYCITTYAPGGKTLPPFEGEPFAVPIRDTLEETMDMFWVSLEPEWRVALGGKQFSDERGYAMAEPTNRFEKVRGK